MRTIGHSDLAMFGDMRKDCAGRVGRTGRRRGRGAASPCWAALGGRCSVVAASAVRSRLGNRLGSYQIDTVMSRRDQLKTRVMTAQHSTAYHITSHHSFVSLMRAHVCVCVCVNKTKRNRLGLFSILSSYHIEIPYCTWTWSWSRNQAFPMQ